MKTTVQPINKVINYATYLFFTAISVLVILAVFAVNNNNI